MVNFKYPFALSFYMKRGMFMEEVAERACAFIKVPFNKKNREAAYEYLDRLTRAVDLRDIGPEAKFLNDEELLERG